ncbi:MAG: glycosyltransferase [Planctomycetota bacterium]
MSEPETRLRILQVCRADPGGSGVLACELAEGLHRHGHEVHLCAARRPLRLRADSAVTLHEAGFAETEPDFAVLLAVRLADLVDRLGIDVLHVHYAWPFAVSAALALGWTRRRPASVTTLHGTDVSQVDPSRAPALGWALGRADVVTAVSSWLGALALSSVPGAPAPRLIPDFVDRRRFHADGRRGPPADGAWRLLHAGNFRPVKRPLDAVEVFARVHARFPRSRLVLAGEGPLLPRVLARAQALGLGPAVEVRGTVADMPALYRTCDLALVTSASESFSLVALEAQACGVPVVGTITGGLPEVVEAGVGGELRPVGDVAGLADAALALLSDPRILAAYGRRAAATAPARFDAERTLAAWTATYVEARARYDRAHG